AADQRGAHRGAGAARLAPGQGLGGFHRPRGGGAGPRARGPGVHALGELRAEEGPHRGPPQAPGAAYHASFTAVGAPWLPWQRPFLRRQRVPGAAWDGAGRLVAAAPPRPWNRLKIKHLRMRPFQSMNTGNLTTPLAVTGEDC